MKNNIFNPFLIYRHFGHSLEAEIIVKQNELFAQQNNTGTTHVLKQEFEHKLISEEKISFEKDIFYMLELPSNLKNLEDFQVITFSNEHIDDKGTFFSVYERSLSSVLIKFQKQTQCTIVVWTNRIA